MGQSPPAPPGQYTPDLSHLHDTIPAPPPSMSPDDTSPQTAFEEAWAIDLCASELEDV